MEKSVQITFIIVAAVVLLVLVGFLVYNSRVSGPTLNSNGQAQIKAIPDLLTVYFNIQTNGTTAKEAKDKNAEIVDAVTVALLKEGFERKDIQTQNFNIYPEYKWENNEQKEIGYTATHSLKLELSTDKIDKIGDVIDAGVDNGATISYINFELSVEKQNEYKAEALKLATQDARIKAEAIASGLGKKVGNVVSISTSDFGYYPWRIYEEVSMANAAEAKAATTDIQPSEQEINANVQVVFKLK